MGWISPRMSGIMWNPWSQAASSLNVKRGRLCLNRGILSYLICYGEETIANKEVLQIYQEELEECGHLAFEHGSPSFTNESL